MDEGVILVGEAAKAYITYKYVELAVVVVFMVALIYGCYKLIKSIPN